MDLINFLDIVNDDENEIDDLVRMNRQLVYRCNPFERYNDLEFHGRYRFSKAATRRLWQLGSFSNISSIFFHAFFLVPFDTESVRLFSNILIF